MILVVAEHRTGAVNRVTWETIAAAEAVRAAGHVNGPLKVALLGAPGSAADAAAGELASSAAEEIVAVESAALDMYTADGYVGALASVLPELDPKLVLLPHTYQTRDFAPALAARLTWPLIVDVTAVTAVGGEWGFTRPMFQGRLSAVVRPQTEGPFFLTVQAGAFKADAATRRASAPIRRLAVALDAQTIRQQPEPPFRHSKQAVDLSQAERIVAVGRGIRDEAYLALARQLADAFQAELGASRPVCDSGWMPMDRQIGSSGQTVAPRLYVAVGISGAIQHVVGMKGSGVVVAINKDPDAPIFEIADYGIVADLFDVVPELIAALHA